MATAHISIGSNIGDRRALIGQAVAAVETLCGSEAKCSDIMESEPWGYDSPNTFMNMSIAVTTNLGPHELLNALLRIQNDIDPSPHRDDTGQYTDRAIDIDLIAIDDMIIDSPELTLPHPRMHMREFVLKPMCQTAPGWRHPILHLTPAEALERLLRND